METLSPARRRPAKGSRSAQWPETTECKDDDVDDRVRLAVGNNARWCDLVCRAAQIATSWQNEFWVARQPSPRFYPEAITLREKLAPAALIDELPSGRCSIKDSFADLNLAHDGFEELFDTWWIYRDPSAVPARADSWTVVDTAEDFAEWIEAWGLVDVLSAGVLGNQTVRILERRRGQDVVGGAILNWTGPAVSISNVFSRGMALDELWSELVAFAAQVFPSCPIVGYERGDALDAAVAVGFAALAPLRIWLQVPSLVSTPPGSPIASD
jgi:hypothetical protein